MRAWACLLLLGCSSSPLASEPEIGPESATPIAPVAGALPAIPEALVFSIELSGAEVRVLDVNGRALDALRRAEHASLVVNAGFFDPAFRPEGLVVSEHRELSALVPSLSGGVLTIEEGRGRLYEAETYAAAAPPELAIQCRPRLVVDGHNNLASDTGALAERTALCLRSDALHREGRVLEVVLVPHPITLYALAEALLARGCHDALNLDGGPSTGGAWRDPSRGAMAIEPPGPVRQAVVIRLAPP